MLQKGIMEYWHIFRLAVAVVNTSKEVLSPAGFLIFALRDKARETNLHF